MKFTPNIDKNAVLHDTTKKIHVSFEDIEPIVEKKTISKKRSHPAHESDSKQSKKKAKKSSENKEDKKKKNKKEKKSKSEKPLKTEEPVKVEKPIVTPVEQKTPTENPAEPKTEEAAVPKVRGPKFTPKKVKIKGKQPPKKLTKEEMQAKVAAIRKKKALKRQAKVKINGEIVAKPALQLVPGSLTKVMPTKQLGEFVLYALSETTNLPWCSIVHKAKVEHVVMIYAQGLNSTDFGISHTDKVPVMIDLDTLNSEDWIGKAAMPFLTKQARYMITNEISGRNGRFNSPVADVLQCNMSNSKKERLAKEQTAKMAKFKGNMREFYVLSLEDLRKADFPVPPFLDETSVLPEGWKETHAPIEPTTDADGRKRIIAVDCEMVLTAKGSALARITLIDEDGSVLLDELVKPDLPIIDYLTKYSGITPAAMSTATCSLRRAQKHVRKLVNHNVILVGHGLENDLKAMQLAHPYCVDTSLLYDHHRGPPYKPSLRFLARNYLKRHIQEHNKARIGHDSAEDARATLDLFKLKLENKPSFGRFKQTELIMDRLLANRPSRASVILESSTSNARSFGSSQGGDYDRVDTDEELVNLTLEKVKEKHFLFTRYQSVIASATVEGEESAAPGVVPSAALEKSERAIKLQNMDEYIRRVYQGLPENSFLVVAGGVCDVPMYKSLYDRHQKYQEKYGSKKVDSVKIPKNEQWTEEDQKLLCKYALQARTSSSFFIFKR